MSPQAHSQIEVLISGAGPTGLFQALLLTRMGIPVRIIDRAPAISPLSKALGIQPRTTEILQLAGVIDPFLKRGQFLREVSVFFGSEKHSSLDVRGWGISHFDSALFIDQERTCQIFVKELEKLKVKVEFGWELVDTEVESTEDGQGCVRTTIRRSLTGDNSRVGEGKEINAFDQVAEQEGMEYETEVVMSKYLVGADGGRSTVRHQIKMPFPGRTMNNKFVMCDASIQESTIQLSSKDATVVIGTNGKFLAFLPLDNGDWRFILQDDDFEPNNDLTSMIESLSVKTIETMANACLAPGHLKIKEATWLTTFRINERRAERFAYKGRIFLAGDAAHIHSPTGGQGMNTGLQDAYNLAWKMALVLRGVAPSTLLDTYAEEREPMADRAIKLSSELLEGVFGKAAQWMIKLGLWVAPMALSVAKRMSYVPEVTMLGIRYPPNSINRTHSKQAATGKEYEVGVRAADGVLHPWAMNCTQEETSSKDSIRVHELIQGDCQFHILVFVAGTLTSKKTPDLPAHIKGHLLRWRSRWFLSADRNLFETHVIAGPSITTATKDTLMAASSMAMNEKGEGKVYVDSTKAVHSRYGCSATKGQGSLVVIRPDGHVGYCVQGTGESAWQDVDNYFGAVLSSEVDL